MRMPYLRIESQWEESERLKRVENSELAKGQGVWDSCRTKNMEGGFAKGILGV